MQRRIPGLIIAVVLTLSPLAFAGNNGTPAKPNKSSTWTQVLQAWGAGIHKTTYSSVKKACSSLTECEYAVTYGSTLEKAYASGVLSTMGASAVPALTKALVDENEHIRDIAATSLREIGPDAKDAIPALIKLLGDDSAFRFAQDALSSIGKEAIPGLISLFPEPEEGSETKESKDNRWHIRRRAIAIFGNIGGFAVPDLIEVLKSEKNNMAQDFAAESLGNIGPAAKAAVPALIQHITASNRYKKQSMQNLGPKYQGLLKGFLASTRETDIFWGAYALGKIGPDAKEAVPTLISLLQEIKDEEYNVNKQRLSEALGGIGPEASASVTLLIQLLKDPIADVRLATIVALGEMGPSAKEAKPNLEAILKFAESEKFKDAAKTALNKIGATS